MQSSTTPATVSKKTKGKGAATLSRSLSTPSTSRDTSNPQAPVTTPRVRKSAPTKRKSRVAGSSSIPVTPSPLAQSEDTINDTQQPDDVQSVASASTARPDAAPSMSGRVPVGSTTGPSVHPQNEEDIDEEDDLDWEDDNVNGADGGSGPDREAVRALLDTFTEEQSHRYEAYRRSHLPKAAMRKFAQNLLGYPVPPSVGIILAGCGKMFIGQMVECGLEIMDQQGDTVLTPDHLREAFKIYQRKHSTMESKSHKKQLFR